MRIICASKRSYTYIHTHLYKCTVDPWITRVWTGLGDQHSFHQKNSSPSRLRVGRRSLYWQAHHVILVQTTLTRRNVTQLFNITIIVFNEKENYTYLWRLTFIITSWQIDGEKKWRKWQILFSWAPKSLYTVTAATKWKDTCSLEEKLGQPREHIKKQRDHFANKGPSSRSYDFSSSHVQMWEWDHKEGWVAKNWCFQIVVLEKTLESPLDSKEIKPVNPKGNQPEYSLEGLMLKLQSFGHLMQRADSLEKTQNWERLRAEEGGDRGWEGWVASLTQRTWVWANSGR